MCGIVAISCSEPCVSDEVVLRALKSIEHRGPDGLGYWISEDKRLAIGNVRLAIIDPRDEGLQPMFNEDGTVGVVLNGEIYNFKEIRKNLKEKHEFLTNTDTEVLLHAYEEFGENVVHALRGMFAFAIYDEKSGSLMVSRDHVGKKPVYVYEGEGKVVVASEPSAIKSIVKKLEPDPVGAFQMFMHVSPPPERSYFKEVYMLRNGEYIIIKSGKVVKRKKYYTLRFKESEFDIRKYVRELHKELVRAVEYRLIADVPIALALSSGVDSTLLASIITKEIKKEDIAAFTVTVSGAGEYDEVELASEVAEELNMEHEIIEFDFKNYVATTYELTRKIGVPITDPSLVLGYGIAKAARGKGYKVIIVGEGGDELFFGYPVYKKFYESLYGPFSLPLIDLPAWVSDSLRRFYNHVLCLLSIRKLCTARNMQAPAWHCKLQAVPNALQLAVYRYRISESASAPRNFAERLLSYEYNYRIPNHLTLKVDFYSMAASVEARAPLLDYKLIEKAMSISPAWKRYIMLKEPKLVGKLILKRYLSERTWSKVVSRKIGFGQQAIDVLTRIAVEMSSEMLRRSTTLKNIINIEEYERLLKKRPRSLLFVSWLIFAYGVWEEVMSIG